MRKVFIVIIETEYGDIDKNKLREIKEEIEDFNTEVSFYKLDEADISNMLYHSIINEEKGHKTK